MNKEEKELLLKKYRPTLDLKKIGTFIVAHPGLAIFSIYALIATAGFIYLLTFYRYFNLDVIVYLELADILTAGIKDPMVMLMVLGAFSLVGFVWLITYISAPFSAWLDMKFSKGFWKFLPHLIAIKSTKVFWYTAVFILTIYFIMFIVLHSRVKAELIEKEKINLIHVESDANINYKHEYSLLGTSINYVFLYDHSEKETLILPLENIKLLKPIHKKEE